MENLRGISIIICCYNSISRIKKTLEHIAAQKISDSFSVEVLLIDNNSNDGTSAFAKKVWNNLDCSFPFKILLEKNQGLSHARILGFNKAKYEFILFCDDDNWLNNDYVQNAFHFISNNKKAGVIGGWGKAASDHNLPEWFYQTNAYGIGRPIPSSGETDRLEHMIYGAGMIIRKSIYFKLIQAGFSFQLTGRKGDKVSGGEDIELFYAILIAGNSILFDDRLIFQHYIPKERLSEKYIKDLSFYGIKNSAVISAYYHEYKKYPCHSFFYYTWILKSLFSSKPKKELHPFIKSIQNNNRKESLRYIRNNKKEYFDTRKKIKAWTKLL